MYPTRNIDTLGNELGKLFIGGLSQLTTEKALAEYFSKFGAIKRTKISYDPHTNRSRGFGYVFFKEHVSIDKVLGMTTHMLDGKVVDPKQSNINMKGKNKRCLKIFVGGLPHEKTGDDVARFFEQYAKVVEVNLREQTGTGKKNRGFAYVTFENEEIVNQLVALRYINFDNKRIEIKPVEPRSSMSNIYNNNSLSLSMTEDMMMSNGSNLVSNMFPSCAQALSTCSSQNPGAMLDSSSSGNSAVQPQSLSGSPMMAVPIYAYQLPPNGAGQSASHVPMSQLTIGSPYMQTIAAAPNPNPQAAPGGFYYTTLPANTAGTACGGFPMIRNQHYLNAIETSSAAADSEAAIMLNSSLDLYDATGSSSTRGGVVGGDLSGGCHTIFLNSMPNAANDGVGCVLPNLA